MCLSCSQRDVHGSTLGLLADIVSLCEEYSQLHIGWTRMRERNTSRLACGGDVILELDMRGYRACDALTLLGGVTSQLYSKARKICVMSGESCLVVVSSVQRECASWCHDDVIGECGVDTRRILRTVSLEIWIGIAQSDSSESTDDWRLDDKRVMYVWEDCCRGGVGIVTSADFRDGRVDMVWDMCFMRGHGSGVGDSRH
ncbi:hypothetical protein Tco_0275752 [Tanacetum coccineum]